jgi:hypothetical protein
MESSAVCSTGADKVSEDNLNLSVSTLIILFDVSDVIFGMVVSFVDCGFIAAADLVCAFRGNVKMQHTPEDKIKKKRYFKLNLRLVCSIIVGRQK